MRVLNEKELNSMLSQSITANSYKPFSVTDALNNLYTTGARVNELFNSELWSIDKNGNIILQPSKGNNERYMPNTRVTPYFLDSIINNYVPYPDLNIAKLRYHFRSLLPYEKIYVGNKEIELHLFRHRYLKLLHSQGMDFEAIQSEMGYTSTKVVNGYVNSLIMIN